MKRRTAAFGGIVALLAAALAAACAAGGTPAGVRGLDDQQRARLARMMAEEDARPAADDAGELRAGLAADSALLRRFAVRGLGRLEDPAGLPAIEPLLADPDPAVRAQAADAVAQAVYNEASATAATMLQARLAADVDPAARGALAMALGRLRPVDAAAAGATFDTLVELTHNAPPETLVPALRGIEWLVRSNADDLQPSGDNAARLVALTHYGRSGGEGHLDDGDAPVDPARTLAAARVRRLALAALRAGAALAADTVETALYDPDVEVRRLAAAAAAAVPQRERRQVLLKIALADTAAPVRYEGLGGYAQELREQAGCTPVVEAVDDADAHVSLRAIDLLSQACDGVDGTATTGTLLAEIAGELPGLAGEATPAGVATMTRQVPAAAWQRSAHALVSLARLDAAGATAFIPRYARHPTWQVRLYAARAALVSGDAQTLQLLTADAHPNVVEAALRGLAERRGDSATPAAIAALGSDDYQLLITAAGVLESSDAESALPALLDALARVTAPRRQTSRDPRVALLERIGELGGAANAEAVRPYLRDFDPRVAALAARILRRWTGNEPSPEPQPPAPLPFPSIDELLALDGAVASIHMAGGGVVDIELHAFEAPTNVARFARQARSGYFEGLTFHRVVPNFVVQGGSPGGNEYMGDGPYTRDEVGTRSHLRGTVGISTRGRDTGDSQLFFNLVDNLRLDHAYTIIGTVIGGMEVIDGAQEGATIERVDIAPPREGTGEVG